MGVIRHSAYTRKGIIENGVKNVTTVTDKEELNA